MTGAFPNENAPEYLVYVEYSIYVYICRIQYLCVDVLIYEGYTIYHNMTQNEMD